MEALFNTFVVLFIVIDPVGLAPMFLALTHGASVAQQRKMALRGTTLAAAMLLIFFFIGDTLLAALGIGLPAFRIAGGALLMVLGLTLVSLWCAVSLLKFLGETGSNVISRLFGLVLAALAVLYILDGLRAALAALGLEHREFQHQ